MRRRREPASRQAAAVLLALLAAVNAHADGANPWYASLGIGWDYAENVAFDETGEILGLDLGIPVLSAAFGRRVSRGWRAELELAHRFTDPEVLYAADATAEVEPDPRDQGIADSLTVNLLRELDLGIGIKPYLGIGAGVARLDFEVSEIEIAGLNVQRPRRMIIDDKGSGFAAQLIAGFTAPLSRRLELGADYRYWRAPDVTLETTAGQKLEIDHAVHSAWLHLRYAFSDRAPGRAARVRKPVRRGLYLASRVGAGFAADANINDSFDNFDAFDIGPAAAIAAGWDTGGRWRFEVEGAYRANHPEIIDFSPEVGQFRARGKVKARSLLANAVYQLQTAGPVRPYAAAGAGLAWVEYDVSSRGAVFADGDDSAFAGQAVLGLDAAVTARLRLAAEYRFWATADLTVSGVETSHQVHAVMLGLSYSLAFRP